MRVEVDEKYDVSYTRSTEEFAYIFNVFPAIEGAKTAVSQIVEAMENQSYDHGAEWRTTYFNELPSDDETYKVFKVGFRIKDSY